MKTPYDKQIEDIMESFDFGSVQIAMKALNWTWFTSFEEDARVPRVHELTTTARRLLNDAASWKSDGTLECGGFCAERKNGILTLSFGWKAWGSFRDWA